MKTDYDFTENGSFEVNKDGALVVENSKGNVIYSKTKDGYEYWKEYDSAGNIIHAKNSYEWNFWWEYDENNNCIHYKNSDGLERWYNGKGDKITKEEFDSTVK